MSQFARPSEDTFLGDWTDEAAGTTDIFESIDESSASDADYIQSPVEPSSDPYVCKLDGIASDPLTSDGHVVRYRYRKDTAGGDQIDLTVQLREGYVNEGTPGTLIHEETHTDISGSGWTNGSFTLDSGEADSITDYDELFLRFVADTP